MSGVVAGCKNYLRALVLGDYEIHRLSMPATQHCLAADAHHVTAAIIMA
jgi:hypothetical protein